MNKIDLNGKKATEKQPTIFWKPIPDELEMIDDLCAGYKIYKRDGTPNRQGMIRYLIRAGHRLLGEGRKV